ncbi:unnamed protein product [Parajaminaea phylloscopi]
MTETAAPQAGSEQAQAQAQVQKASGEQQRLGDGTLVPAGMTKSAFKKLRRKEAWDASKEERRAANRQKRRAKVRKQRDEWRGLPEDEKVVRRKEKKIHQRQRTAPFGANIVIDCSFDELMSEREIVSMGSQISFLYASYRRTATPFKRLILAGPSRRPILSCIEQLQGDDVSALKEYEPNEDAVQCGYHKAVQEAAQSGRCLSFDESRVGRQLNSIGEAHWTRWKNVNIVKSGGIEAVWDPTLQAQAAPGDSDQPAAAETHALVAGESCVTASSTVADTPKDQPEESLAPQTSATADLGTDSAPKKRRRGARKPRFATDATITDGPLPPIRKEDVIYLTADTEETIPALEEGKTYVIGGIVDRNRYKNVCLAKAQSLGLRVARLPIDADHLGGKHMNSRQVLTVNQVFDILLGWTEQYAKLTHRTAKPGTSATDQAGAGGSEADAGAQTAQLQDGEGLSYQIGDESSQRGPGIETPPTTLPSWQEALALGLPERKFAEEPRKTRRIKARVARLNQVGTAPSVDLEEGPEREDGNVAAEKGKGARDVESADGEGDDESLPDYPSESDDSSSDGTDRGSEE